MTLYVANPSTQNWKFPYREPINNLINVVELPSGTQSEIGHKWSAAQQAKVIEQLQRFGARDAAESHGKMGKFNGLLFRDRGAISSSEIEMGHDAELTTREERSRAEVVKDALGFDRVARKANRSRPAARETQTVVKQELAPNERPRGTEVDFDLTVSPEGRSDVTLPIS
jgi:hypothetical protein